MSDASVHPSGVAASASSSSSSAALASKTPNDSNSADDEEDWGDTGGGTDSTVMDDGDWGDTGDADWGDDDDGTGGVEHVDESMPDAVSPILTRQQSYCVLDANALREKQDALLKQTAEVLFVTPEEAGCLLRHYGWKSRRLQQDWFEKGSKTVRAEVGITDEEDAKPIEKNAEGLVQCHTAYCDEVPIEQAHGLRCGHVFCEDCWKNYLTSQIQHGTSCIFASCMGMKCNENHVHKLGCACKEMVPESLFYKYVSDAVLLEKYERWMLDSFVEGQRNVKWCPRPGCSYAVTYQSGGTKTVHCKCGYDFCFSCGAQGHVGCPCDLVEKWLRREQSDDATQIWLQAKTKECPKCQVRIEKNKACNHMSCTKCGHHFCITADSRITLANGTTIRLSDMEALLMKHGDVSILSLDTHTESGIDGRESGFKVGSAVAFLKRGIKRCIELTLQDGRTLTCTPDHKIMTTKGWVEAQDLIAVGSGATTSQHQHHRIICGLEGPLDDPALDSHSAFSFHLARCGKVWSMSQHRDVVLAIARLLGSLASSRASIHTNPAGTIDCARLHLQHRIDAEAAYADVRLIDAEQETNDGENGCVVSLGASLAADLASLVGVDGAKRLNETAPLPPFLLDPHAPLSVVREFLAAYFGCDGAAPQPQPDGVGPTWRGVCFSFLVSSDSGRSATQMLQQLPNLLESRFNVPAGDISNMVSENEYRLTLSSDATLSFHDMIGFRYSCHKQIRLMAAASHMRAMETAQKQVNAPSFDYNAIQWNEMIGATSFFPALSDHRSKNDALSSTHTTLPYITLGMVSKRDAGFKPVYDISVSNTHNFLANGLTVHNCWLCKEPWDKHGSSSGGYYVCLKYDASVKEGKYSQEEKNNIENQKLLQKYTYYYQRYKSSQDAIGMTKKLGSKLEKSLRNQDLQRSSFIFDATEKLCAARRVLQWTFALAYYLKSGAQKLLFEYQQQLLVEATEALQDIMENHSLEQLHDLRKDIINKTSSIDKFRQEMVAQVERGDFEDLLLSQADTAAEKWGCPNCRTENDKKNTHCINDKCGSCRLHGEPDCKASTCKTQARG